MSFVSVRWRLTRSGDEFTRAELTRLGREARYADKEIVTPGLPSRTRRLGALAAVLTAGAVLATGSALPAAAATSSTPACGAVILPGSAWLGGGGVDVHYNVHVNGSTASCGTQSIANPAVQYGGAWQCIELAARLYYVKGWGQVYAGKNGGAQYIPEGSPNLQFYANGSGYVPVPGDLVVEWGGTWGHVTIVEAITPGSIETVEQNVGVNARHSYPFVNGFATGGYAAKGVRGFMHSPANTNRGTGSVVLGTGGGSAASGETVKGAPVAPAITSVRKGKQKVRLGWNTPVSQTKIAGFQMWIRVFNKATKSYSQDRVVSVPAGKRAKTIKALQPKTIYRFNVRASNASGFGNWSNGRNVMPRA